MLKSERSFAVIERRHSLTSRFTSRMQGAALKREQNHHLWGTLLIQWTATIRFASLDLHVDVKMLEKRHVSTICSFTTKSERFALHKTFFYWFLYFFAIFLGNGIVFFFI